MAETKGFDLAALLGGVSKLNIGGEAITRLTLELIDPDPDNFYSLDGLDELAANIETVGLLDPIRVRPSGERYMIVSGHRRRAACQLIADGGSDMFASGVPCIVEYGEASDAMRRLRLIYANSATRQLTSAELSRQAEEVTRLLYELKEQGVEFPGRMRDHVAEACNVTKSKLARIAAIRHNADEYVLDAYDKGEINEATAYELQKLDRYVQHTFMVEYRRAFPGLDNVTADMVKEIGALAERLKILKCAPSGNWNVCKVGRMRFETALRRKYKGQWGYCQKGWCCSGCPQMMSCEDLCHLCQSEKDLREQQVAAREAEEERKREYREAQRRAEREETARKNGEIWARIRKAAESSGVDLRAALRAVYAEYYDDSSVDEAVAEALSYAAALCADECGEVEDLLHDSAPKLAAALGCSIDWLYGLADTPRATPQSAEPTAPLAQGSREAQTDAPAPWPTEWQTGEPEADGWYAVRGEWKEESFQGVAVREVLFWGGAWYPNEKATAEVSDIDVRAWFPLPEEDEG